MLYRGDSKESLLSLAERVNALLPALADTGEAAGPLIELRGLSPDQLPTLRRFLRDVEDYELTCSGPNSGDLARLAAVASHLRPFDRLEAFWGEYGSVGLEGAIDGETQVTVDFTSPFEIRRRNLPIPFQQLANPAQRLAVLLKVLQGITDETVNRAEGTESSQEAERLLRARHDRPIQLRSGITAATPVWDEGGKINHVVILKGRFPGDVGRHLSALTDLSSQGWRARFFGVRDRIETLAAVIPPASGTVAYGGTEPRQRTLAELEYTNNEARLRELNRGAITFPEFRAIVDVAPGIERISIGWKNLRRWVVGEDGELSAKDAEVGSENSLDVVSRGRRPASLYVAIGGSLPAQRIKAMVEMRLGMKLRSCKID